MSKGAKRGKDKSGEAWLKRRGPVEDAVATFHGPMSSAVDLDELSTVDYLTIGTDVEPNLLIKEGYGALVARYGREVKVELATPVKAVKYDGAGVEVETAKGTVKARACVVTSSTGVLAAEKIRFDPVLPEWKRDAIAAIPMGLLAKIPLQFQSSGLFGLQDFDDLLREQRGKRDIYFLSFPFHLPLMVGFVGGDFAWELSAAGEREAVDYGMNHLRHMLGSDVDKQLVKGSFTRWAGDPWALGAYATATPGNGKQREALRRTVADRIYFAGEACAPRWTQTCGGAALSGRETAEAIHKALGKA
jgi:monoamine oxidase